MIGEVIALDVKGQIEGILDSYGFTVCGGDVPDDVALQACTLDIMVVMQKQLDELTKLLTD